MSLQQKHDAPSTLPACGRLPPSSRCCCRLLSGTTLQPAAAGQPRCLLIPACANRWPASRRTLPRSDAEPTTELFVPIYSLALAPDPLLAAAESSGPAAEQGTQQAQQGAQQGAQQAQRDTQQAQQGAQQGAQQAQQDVFLAVGLDSGLTDFKRPRLNLAILLDVSGSMDGERAGERGLLGSTQLVGEVVPSPAGCIGLHGR